VDRLSAIASEGLARLPEAGQLFSPSAALASNWAQTAEKNRGRQEIRTLCMAPINPEQACFPAAAQCGALLHQGLGEKPELQYLLTSRCAEELPVAKWLEAQRTYWGIEGLHQRLDAGADEDRSRARNRNACWTLSMFRRIAVSLLMHWRTQNPKHAKATLTDFSRRDGPGTSTPRLRIGQ
jgi:hypothetical protein